MRENVMFMQVRCGFQLICSAYRDSERAPAAFVVVGVLFVGLTEGVCAGCCGGAFECVVDSGGYFCLYHLRAP